MRKAKTRTWESRRPVTLPFCLNYKELEVVAGREASRGVPRQFLAVRTIRTKSVRE